VLSLTQAQLLMLAWHLLMLAWHLLMLATCW